MRLERMAFQTERAEQMEGMAALRKVKVNLFVFGVAGRFFGGRFWRLRKVPR